MQNGLQLATVAFLAVFTICAAAEDHFFTRSTTQKDERFKYILPSKEVDATCLSQAEAGHCRFYRCLRERFTCDKFQYARDAEFSCRRMGRFAGGYEHRQLITQFNKCMMRSLSLVYQSGTNNCFFIKEFGQQLFTQCFIQHNLCELLQGSEDEKRAFQQMFGIKTVMDAQGEVSEALQTCNLQQLNSFFHWMTAR
ncbi:uncharacterized protein LOC106160865 [Lingula anatina]|uniref:Uncharacterized protein LOC106160865 n=1 Tax=Lingula anatina TaxID=7574 RepID=A0A1S3I5H7_LINAN|nr:uncharacterized protein LOC106160865 [Lingula anatina]|eukprot:XP_013393086.1 uncharacterized protein LOC106160865 [Lingula anatina]